MPLTMRKDARNFPFQVIAKSSGGELGAPVPAEVASASVTGEPANIAVVSLDPNPVAVNNPFDPASGAHSVISGVVNATAVGDTTLTAALLAPDGSTFASVTDTVSVVEPGPGVAEWDGTLFGATKALDLPAPGAKAKGAAVAPPPARNQATEHEAKHHR